MAPQAVEPCGLMGSVVERVVADPAATEAEGAALAANVRAGDRIYLQGDLGSGKTTLVRGLLRALGFRETVRSPTFTLVETYAFRDFPVYHFDLYRLSRPEDLEAIGFRDYFDGAGICLVEWPERAGSLLSQPDLRVSLAFEGEGRRLRLDPLSPRGSALLSRG